MTFIILLFIIYLSYNRNLLAYYIFFRL